MGEYSAERALKARRIRKAGLRSTGPSPNPFMLFFGEFLRHPAMIGAVLPSSQKTIDHMLSKVDWANTRLFVEYGPGVGTFCGDILARLPADGTLLVIDTNPVFVDYLRRRFADPRFLAVNGSAADVNQILADHGFDKADYILSGLPFSTLPDGVAPAIAEATHRALRVGGAFLVYQYSRFVEALIAPHFARIDNEREWVNLPPCQLFWAWKGDD
jgi:phospholipid N-methyltransferase